MLFMFHYCHGVAPFCVSKDVEEGGQPAEAEEEVGMFFRGHIHRHSGNPLTYQKNVRRDLGSFSELTET